jgi:hypothetical protein
MSGTVESIVNRMADAPVSTTSARPKSPTVLRLEARRAARIAEVNAGSPLATGKARCACCGGKFDKKDSKGRTVCSGCGDTPGSPEQATAAKHGKDKVRTEAANGRAAKLAQHRQHSAYPEIEAMVDELIQTEDREISRKARLNAAE